MSEGNLQRPARVAAALRRANVRADFVGGATISLYLEATQRPPLRHSRAHSPMGSVLRCRRYAIR